VRRVYVIFSEWHRAIPAGCPVRHSRLRTEVVKNLLALMEPNGPVLTFLLALDELKVPTSPSSPHRGRDHFPAAIDSEDWPFARRGTRCNIIELIRGLDVHREWTKETKREVPSDPGPERHSLLARLPVEVHLSSRCVTTVTRDLHLTAPTSLAPPSGWVFTVAAQAPGAPAYRSIPRVWSP
jgi:hypothetical protein